MPSTRLVTFGTDEPPPAEQRFSAGALSLVLSDGAVRALSWHGTEVVRGIACPIRDANWATYVSVLNDESVTTSPSGFEITQVRLIADGALRVKLVFTANSDGLFSATAEMSAKRDFVTNRAGFTILHPLQDVAGTPMSVKHPDGSEVPSCFPLMISPTQVAGDISGLRHSVNGIESEMTFKGEVFEMEDQRNWSDASFKTYCRPLSLPMPYTIRAGEVQRQEIHIRFRGTPTGRTKASIGASPDGIEIGPALGTVPRIAVAMDENTIPDANARKCVQLINTQILQLRVRPETARAVYERAKSIAASNDTEVELEIVIPSAEDPDASLQRVAENCRHASLPVARVLALPEVYLRSYQPSGPWPDGPTPQHLVARARKAFPGAGIGGGVLTYFTELNRCRPDPSACDYIAHGSTAITHAADDRSVIESLEGLSHIFRSARALAGGQDYRLGLVAIGMRSNPYGAGVMENARQARVAMAGADPRQRGLFAAAWAVGAIAATQGYGVSSLALSAFVGPFGLIHRRESWAQPIYQDSGVDGVYPIFHVVRFMNTMAGAARQSVRSAQKEVVGVASKDPSRLVLTNLGTVTSRVRLSQAAEIRILDSRNFWSAIHDPGWLDGSEVDRASDVTLEPFAVAFVDMRG